MAPVLGIFNTAQSGDEPRGGIHHRTNPRGRRRVHRGLAARATHEAPSLNGANQVDVPELLARESIRDLVARYNANGDSGRFGPMMELFAEDAVVEFSGHGTYSGRDEIRSLFTGAAGVGTEPPEMIRHHVSTHQIDLVSSGIAKGRAYFVVYTGAGVDHWGRYIDDYREEGGRW